MKILLTGATGFVGASLVNLLARDERIALRAAVRDLARGLPDRVEHFLVGDLTLQTNWQRALGEVDVVIHLAARVHVMEEGTQSALAKYERINVFATTNLASQAAAAGIGRFIFLSSLKVNGERGAFCETDTPMPNGAYANSKYEAELALHRIAHKTGMEVVVIRAPLVYGPGVRANFRWLMRLVKYGVPLPFGAVDNRRSLIGVDNLTDFIQMCIWHPMAAKEVFLVSDGVDLSTKELIHGIACAMNRSARLFRVPASLLMAGASLVGRQSVARRLLESLQVKSSKAQQLLGWTPPVSVDEGLRRAVVSL